MPGGLIQITTSGTSDLLLTGNPQITFFLIVFRRYTNFGKKIIELGFDNNVNFNSTSIISIPKNYGDLLSKLILKIKLPSLDVTSLNNYFENILSKNISNTINLNNNSITNLNNNSIKNLNINVTINDVTLSNIVYYVNFITFYNNFLNVINNFFNKYDNLNTSTYITDLSTYILSYINVDQFIQFYTTVNYIINNGLSTTNNVNILIFTNATLYTRSNNTIKYIYIDWTSNDMSYDLFKFTINQNISILNELNVIIFNKIINIAKNPESIQISWINKIGIFLFNSIDLYIGSNKINSLSDYYINNYGDLYYKNTELYNKLIGSNQNINNFSVTQDETYLYLSLPLWFNNNYGLSFPLIALQFNTLQLKINLKRFIECISINIDNNIITDNLKSNIVEYLISNQNDIVTSNIEVTLVAEYIFLDSIERKKFAQSAHEYLITQIQEVEFSNLTVYNNSFTLDFYHCCKDIYWFAVKIFNVNDIFNIRSDLNNYTLINENSIIKNNLNQYIDLLYNPTTLFNPYVFANGISEYNNTNFDINLTNYFYNRNNLNQIDYIILESYLYYNSVVLIGDIYNYFNYLQPYCYYNSTPLPGLNIYSFCLSPTETQPTGSCNLSRIPNFSIKLNINNNLKNENNNQNEYKLIVQATNFNVLRFIGGIAATAYTY